MDSSVKRLFSTSLNNVKRSAAVAVVALFAVIALPATAQDGSDVSFEADTITVEQENGLMVASGNVRVIQQGDELSADKITYNQLTGEARATGSVILTTKDGIKHISDEMTLDENFTHAVATPLVTTLSDGSRFSAQSGDHRQQKRTVFDRSVFSPCKCDYDAGESPIWDLRSSTSEHNIETQTITHQNVRMHVFGLPVFYFPVLTHPDATVRRRSGLLNPTFSYSNDNGLTMTTPYYQVISPTQDIEFQPTNFQFRGQGLKTIYRQRWDQSEVDATFYGARLETFKQRRGQVGAVDARFTSHIGTGWRLTSHLYRASQDTFLRRYRYDSTQTLKSHVTASKLTERRYYHVTMSDVQGLREEDTQDKEPTILPSVFYSKVMRGPYRDQIIRHELSALQLDNDEGHEMVRWAALLGSEKKFNSHGHIFTGSADLLASYYDIHKTNNASDKLSTFGQGNAIVSGEWKYPLGILYGQGLESSAVITPRLKAIVIDGSDRTDDVPNRDAADFRLDEANLFLDNRFQGRDFILPGTHVAAGLSAVTTNPVVGDVVGFAGLSYKAHGKTPAGLTISGREDYSDYVASLTVNTPYNLNLSWSGRADYKDLKLNESRSSLDFNASDTSFELEHTQIAQGYFEAAEDDKEEAKIRLTQNLPQNVQLVAEQVWDLSSGQSRRDQSVLSAVWTGGFQDCVTISLDYKRDPYVDRDIKKVNELQLRFSFKYLGSVNSDNLN